MNPQALCAALRQALREAGHPQADAPLEPLPDKGLAHDHVRLAGTALLARVPKQSQLGLSAAEHLAYEAACFHRAAPGGHAPTCAAVLSPSVALPRGALLVQAIDGRPLLLPQELPLLVHALAALHRLPLPAAAQRPPLMDPADPLAALDDELAQQARHLGAAGIAPAAQRAIEGAFTRWRRLRDAAPRPPKRLIAFDAHPGNFLVLPAGRAVLVDLEKARYGAAALDLAHATLHTSTTWDRESRAELSVPEVAAACEQWLAALGDGADTERAWIAPLREAMWLWAVTWCAKWRVLSARPAGHGGDGEDWSTERSDAALVEHVRARVDEYLGHAIVEWVVDECADLRQRFGVPERAAGAGTAAGRLNPAPAPADRTDR
ncbi:MAG: hypothetical protein ACKVQR_00870 [Aquabacterium sp.]